ncbi:MAG TPA: transglycosylase SLT domain-containing protein [Anaeromyxobacteraceae bacterium]|nr:transglycosylase SLT domain-containing protein [Anaeromyxobacteraceae bacterium]
MSQPSLALALALLAAPPPPSAPAFTEADLSPLLDPSLAAAQAAFEAERWEEAARALAAADRPAARLLRGMALASAHRGEEAAAALSGVAEALPEVADRVSFSTGLALEDAGRRAEAAQAYGRVAPGSLVHAEALLARARLELAAGREAAALEALRPALSEAAPADPSRPDTGAAALLLAGEIHASAGRAAEARRSFIDCWARHPLAPASRECLSRQRSLPGAAGAPPGPEDALRRAESLLDANRNAAAVQEIRRGGPFPAPAADEPLGCRASFVLGKAHRKERAYQRAAQALQPVVDRCRDDSLRARALYLLAASAANAGQDGVAIYRRLAREFPSEATADDALFFAADLLARQGKPDEAARLLSELVERYPVGDYRAEALFRLAWLARQRGEAERAAAAFARAEEEYRDRDPYEHARAAYWRARVLAQRGEPGDAAGARAIWEMLAARYPADYYGLLAQARLAGEGSVTPRRPPAGAEGGLRWSPGPLPRDPHFRAGVLWLRLGQRRLAAEELAAVDRRALGYGSPDPGPEPLLLLAELLDRAGDHKAAQQVLRTQGRQILRRPPEGLPLRIWLVAYPPAWRPEVVRWAVPAGVPPDLLQALMREESALDPAVVSAAGAVGLTQLMPSTAQEMARRLKLPRPAAADLANPALNIRLGAAHLGDLLSRFGGSAALALAAYNAGGGAARDWWRARATMPLDEFVEEIPLQETRGYVKRVLRSYAAYRMLYGADGEPGLRIAWRLPPPP